MSIDVELLKFLVQAECLHKNKAAKGIARKIITEKSIKNLSTKQRCIFDLVIMPLLNPNCEEVFGLDEYKNGTCCGNGKVDGESILISYMEHKMLCQLCRYEIERIELA